MQRILILGAAGQVGSALLAQGIAGADLIGRAARDIDITDPAALAAALAATQPALVINCAAFTAVDRAESEAERAFAVNARGAGLVAQACADHGLPLIHLSTDYVFDGSKPAPYTETDPVAPLGVYGQSKAEGEARVRAALPQHLILRLSWIFSNSHPSFFGTMLRLGAERPELRVVNDQIGGPTFAGHIALAIAAMAGRALHHGDNSRADTIWGTYHYADAPDASWHDFAAAIFATAARHGLKTPKLTAIPSSEYPLPAKRPANSRFDCSKLSARFGIARADWRQAVEACCAARAAG